MDPIAWLVAGIVTTVGIATVVIAPRLKRAELRRKLDGGGGSLSGIGAGFDIVWRPSADEARADWEAQIEMPAPAPTPGDEGLQQDGRIVIDLRDARA